MKLESDHLKGYLNTDLKMYEIRTGEIALFDGLIPHEDLFKGGLEDYDWWSIHQFKPILRRFEDMTDDEFENIKCEWENIKRDEKCRISMYIDDRWEYNITHLPYVIVDKLMSLHFDIHNLIDANLAIDAKTIN